MYKIPQLCKQIMSGVVFTFIPAEEDNYFSLRFTISGSKKTELFFPPSATG